MADSVLAMCLALTWAVTSGCNEFDTGDIECFGDDDCGNGLICESRRCVFGGIGIAQRPSIDVLWVIDNSTSMEDEQAELVDRFDGIFTELVARRADFHVGVVTTDLSGGRAGVLQTGPGDSPREGCLAPPDELAGMCSDLDIAGPFLSWDEHSAEPAVVAVSALRNEFRCIASAGTCGAYYERGIEAVVRALSDELRNGANAGFVRPDAILAVLFLSDEDDCSSGGAMSPMSEADCYVEENREVLLDTAAVYEELVEVKGGDRSRLIVGGIIGPPDPRFPEAPTRDEYSRRDADGTLFSCTRQIAGAGERALLTARDGMRYRELIARAGSLGFESSVCDADYSVGLDDLGRVIGQALDSFCIPVELAPPTCGTDADCLRGSRCANPGDPTVGSAYCSDLMASLVLLGDDANDQVGRIYTESGAEVHAFEPDSAFRVDYDASECRTGVALRFAPRSSLLSGERFRLWFTNDAHVAGE